MSRSPEVIVIGEVLVELSSTEKLVAGSQLTLGVSGDVVNAAAASVAAGARTAVLARVADDELGRQIIARLNTFGIDTSLVRLVPGQQGAYFVHSDPTGRREFVYIRHGSAGAGLGPQDVVDAGVESAAVVVSSGVCCAISDSADVAVLEAARRARMFVYDPNFRPRLTSAALAAESLRRLAPHAALVTPACPGETEPLLGTSNPADAAERTRSLGADAVAVTLGADGILLDDGGVTRRIPAVRAPVLVDQTGAGDSLVGTVAGRLSLGDTLVDAIRLGSAAASLSLQGQGGTGFVASLEQIRRHLTESELPAGGGRRDAHPRRRSDRPAEYI